MSAGTDGPNRQIETDLIDLFLQKGTQPAAAADLDACKALVQSYRLVRLDGEAPADESLSFLNPQFLAAARGGHPAIGRASLAPGEDVGDGISMRSRAIVAALKEGHGTIFSPFTGSREIVNTSLGLEWYLHIVGEEVCCASQMGDTMTVVDLETVWVFPQRRLIAFVLNRVSEDTMRSQIARMFFRCLSHAPQLKDYLAAVEGRAPALTDFWCPHMSHNLWNLQTGWANVFAKADLGPVRSYLLYAGQNFFGDLNQLYPERVPDREKICDVRSDADIFVRMLADNLLLHTVKDEFFAHDFVQRVLRHARSRCAPEFLEDVARLKAGAMPLVLTTIRLGNRSWIEQREGFPALFSKLREDFPGMGLVIDGLSSDTAKGWTTAWMSLDAELEMANAIRGALPPDMPVLFSVGRTFMEAIVLIDAADLFIAPSGSGMGLYKWISNMPGLAFSNRFVLDEANPDRWPLHVWHDRAYRRDLVPTVHIPHLLVTDGEESRGGGKWTNFHLDWQALYEASLPLVREAVRAKSGAAIS